jgi:hypothetical protein
MKLIPNRNRKPKNLDQVLPGAMAALDGASDREIEQIVKRNNHASDIHWDVIASQYGFRG